MTPAKKQTLSAKHQDWVHLLLLILMISFLMFWLATWFYHHSCWALGSEPPSVRSQTSFGHWGIGVAKTCQNWVEPPRLLQAWHFESLEGISLKDACPAGNALLWRPFVPHAQTLVYHVVPLNAWEQSPTRDDFLQYHIRYIWKYHFTSQHMAI